MAAPCVSIFGDGNEAKTHAHDLKVLAQVGIGTGNPGVFQGYPHPYPSKLIPMPKGTGFPKTRGYAAHAQVCPQTQPRISVRATCSCVGGWHSFMLMFCIWVDIRVGAGGCSSRTCLASSVSIRKRVCGSRSCVSCLSASGLMHSFFLS